MVSQQKYKALIETFLNKYEKNLSRELITILSLLYQWVSSYSSYTLSKDPEQIKTYVKRGANIMVRFVNAVKEENEVIKEKITSCNLSLLREDGNCSKETKMRLERFRKEYNIFTSAIIGCHDKGTEYTLSLIKRFASILGPDYQKISNTLENECTGLDVERLKL
jgi:hypothetical protein